VGTLPLLHHVEIVVETCISVLDDEGVLHADGGRGQQLIALFKFLIGVLSHSRLHALCLRERSVLDG